MNRLLRRVDWRFLLPNSHPASTICFGDGLLADAVSLISGQMVTRADAVHAECDLSVAVNPDPATLRSAWAALRAGGACYTEWYRPWLGGPAGVRRRLEAAGFTEVTCYWPWPWPSHATPQFWLPLETPNAIRYFLANRPPTRSKRLEVMRAFYRLLWGLCLRTQLVMPICALAYKPAVTHASKEVCTKQGVLEMIRAEWSNWGLGNTPDQVSCVLLTGGLRSINKVVGLVFADAQPEPQLIVKWPRVAESITALEREVATLRAVHVMRPAGMPSVPNVLFCQKKENWLMVGETALTGVPLWTQLRRDNYRSLALQVTAWLAELAGYTEPQPQFSWWNRLVEPVLRDFQASFGAIVDHNMVQATREALAELDHLPLVCEHRDFSPWNVLVAEDKNFVVLDWESAELQGLPGIDLIYFLAYLTFFLDGAMDSAALGLKGFCASYRTMLNPQTVTGAVFHECMSNYASRIGVDPAALHRLRLLVWLIHARSEYTAFVADAASLMGKPTLETLRGSLFVSLWEEEMRHGFVRFKASNLGGGL